MQMHSLKSNYIKVLEEDGGISFGGNQGWVIKGTVPPSGRRTISSEHSDADS